jgi:flagellar hook-associated protein 1 FlgK
MSLTSVLNNATGTLRNIQVGIRTTGDNITNQQVEGYSRRSVVQESVRFDDQSTGVRITAIARSTSPQLRAELQKQMATDGGQSFLKSVYTQIEQLTGSTSTTPQLSKLVDQFTQAWQAFEATPENASVERTVVMTGQRLAEAIGNTAAGVEAIANQTSKAVASDVEQTNEILRQIASANKEIVASQALGQSNPVAEDRRDELILNLSSLIDIQTFTRHDGSISVNTRSGAELAALTPSQLAWDGTDLTIVGAATPLNDAIRDGSIAAKLNTLRTDTASVSSNQPGTAIFEKMRRQLDGFSRLFYTAPPDVPAPFQAQYDNPGVSSQAVAGKELATGFFTSTSPTAADRFTLTVNPALVDGTLKVNHAAGSAMVQDLTMTDKSLGAGGLALSNTTYRSITDGFVGRLASDKTTIDSTAESVASTRDALSVRLKDETGISMDQELANLQMLQQNYGITARLVSTVNDMMQTLEGIIR